MAGSLAGRGRAGNDACGRLVSQDTRILGREMAAPRGWRNALRLKWEKGEEASLISHKTMFHNKVEALPNHSNALVKITDVRYGTVFQTTNNGRSQKQN
jgi:hypothetical protein